MEDRVAPHPTAGEKAVVPSTGDLLGWHRQAVLRGTQELVSSRMRETLWAMALAMPEEHSSL